MLRNIFKVVLIVAGLSFVSLTQPSPLQGGETDPGLLEIITNLFVSLPGLAAAVLFVTAYIKKRVKSNDDVTRAISLAVALVLSTIGFFTKQGIYAAVEWWYIFIYGITVMAMANGLSTWDMIKGLLGLLKLRIPNEQKI